MKYTNEKFTTPKWSLMNNFALWNYKKHKLLIREDYWRYIEVDLENTLNEAISTIQVGSIGQAIW